MISDIALSLIKGYKPLETPVLLYMNKKECISSFDVILKKGDLVMFGDKGMPM
jgi:hypothetical protein